MATVTDIGGLITRSAAIRGGRPRVSGTGVTVRSIVSRHKRGLTPPEIADSYGHLTLAQVHAALAYYHANVEEIESDLAEEEAGLQRLEADSSGGREA